MLETIAGPKITPRGRGVEIDGVVTVKDSSVLGEDGNPVYDAPTHNRYYPSPNVNGKGLFHRRRVDMMFKGLKFSPPEGIPIGITEYAFQRDDGDMKTTHARPDIIPEEKTKLLHLLDGKLYLTREQREADARRKAAARVEKDVYGKAAQGNDPLESIIATQVATAVAAAVEQTKSAYDERIEQMEAELKRRRGGRPKKNPEPEA